MLNQKPKKELGKNRVFVDTSAILAILNRKDSRHQSAEAIYKKLLKSNFRFVLTNFVIAQTHALLIHKTGVKTAREWLINIAYQNFNVLRPQEDMEMEAVRRITKYQDKDYDLTDMLSFLVMEKIKIEYYFSYDKHFKQIGLFNNVSSFLG